MDNEPEPYRIFNDGTLQPTPTLFSPFPRLPTELRHRIWEECFSEPRLLRIVLRQADQRWSQTILYKITNQLGNTISRSPYYVLAEQTGGYFYPQSLGSISYESRQIYRRLYRSRLPIRVQDSDGSRKTKILPINPESTTLWLNTDQNSDRQALVHFMHDLVAYDPNGIGIVHLAIGNSNVMDLQTLSELEPEHLPPPIRTSFSTLLSNSIQSFHSVAANVGDLRCTIGIFTSARAQFHRNLSVPLFCQSSGYRVMTRDPRNVAPDLGHVTVMSDPRQAIFRWNVLKTNFGQQGRHVKIGYIVCGLPGVSTGGYLRTRSYCHPLRQQLLDELAAEDALWDEWSGLTTKNVWGDRMTQDEYVAHKASMPQVAGAWVFNADAMGVIPDITETKYNEFVGWRPKLVKDLSKSHPELWVFHLS